MNNVAVIDCGTNTFHLMIMENSGAKQLSLVFRKSEHVYLAEDGLHFIGAQAWERGIDAMYFFAGMLKKHDVKKVRAIGTAALRSAENGQAFIQEVEKLTGITINQISGDEEARLISEGVRLAFPIGEEPVLIMDVGGGSVEYIICNRDEIFWKQSFNIGISVLYNKFHKTEPISEVEMANLREFLASTLKPLTEELKKYSVSKLIGASGTYDVLDHLMGIRTHKEALYAQIPFEPFYAFFDKVVNASYDQRLQMREIPTQRTNMISVALILIHESLLQTQCTEMYNCHYAMKEGVIAEMIIES